VCRFKQGLTSTLSPFAREFLPRSTPCILSLSPYAEEFFPKPKLNGVCSSNYYNTSVLSFEPTFITSDTNNSYLKRPSQQHNNLSGASVSNVFMNRPRPFGLKAIYFNARSVRNKLNDLHAIMYTESYDIICISETWLNAVMLNGLIDPKSQFKIYRRDRQCANLGGGVCILVCNNIVSSLVDITYTEIEAEIVACTIFIDKDKITIICTYIPPNIGSELFIDTMKCLSVVCQRSNKCIVLGDFNVPKIDWVNSGIPSDAKCQTLFAFYSDLGLFQLIDEPTRGNNILDLLFTNDPLLVCDVQIEMPFCTSDHDSFTFKLYPEQSESNNNTESVKFNWKKADWPSFALYCMNTDWVSMFSVCSSADECWEAFENVLNNGCNLYVPKLKLTKIKRKTHSISIRKLITKKRQCWRIRRHKSNAESKHNYNTATIRLKTALCAETESKEKYIIDSGNLGLFYNHVNSSMSHKSGVAPLKGPAGQVLTADLDKANALNNFFIGVGTVDNGLVPELANNISSATTSTLGTVYFDSSMLIKTISQLKVKSSAGPDGFPPILFKQLIYQLAEPLACLFRLVVQYGTLPNAWKTANVTPIFKKGSPSEPGNYRPISLTSICCKLFETGIKNDLMHYLLEHKLISPSQHGFLSKRSTCTNLLESMCDWTENLDAKKDTLVVNIDFAKAFDSVSIPKLLHKLSHIGLTGKLLSCIASFLTDRKQRVRVGQSYSEFGLVISGVPQGSVLGPVLFIIFINDVCDVFKSDVSSKLYADDLKSYICQDKHKDSNEINIAMSSLDDWASRWQLPVSYSKCNYMLISNRYILNDAAKTELKLGNSVLKQVFDNNDLGVQFNSQLSFSNHISTVIVKAKQRLFLLNRSFITKNPTVLLIAYKTYILPILDYCSQVWSPYTITDITRLESVQRLFTKKLKGFENLCYAARLVKANLCSLELRRLRADLVFCYKMLHNLSLVSNIDKFFTVEGLGRTRGHNWKLKAKTPRLETRLHFFAYRTAAAWNNLMDLTVCAPTLFTFKKLLFAEDLSQFLSLNFDKSLN